MLRSLDNKHEALLLSSGLVAPEDVAQARATIEQMSKLGAQRALLDILVERKVIAPEVAAIIRQRAESSPDPKTELELEEAEEVYEVAEEAAEAIEVVDEPLVVREGNPTSVAYCTAHPRMHAVGECAACGEPVCSDCVIRVKRRMYCSQDCVHSVGEKTEKEASEVTDKIGTVLVYARWPLIGLAAFTALMIGRMFVNDYRASMALNTAKIRGETTREGVEALRRAASLRPRRADVRGKYGEALLQTGEAALAVEEFKAAVSRDPTNVQLVMGLASAYIVRNMGAEAAEALVNLRKTNSGSAETEYRLGKIYRDQLSQHDLAAEAFERALKLGTESREVRYEVGRAYFRQGLLDEADRQLSLAIMPAETGEEALLLRERAFLRSERAADAFALKAEILARRGKLAEAETLLATAMSGRPPVLPLVLARAKLLGDQNKHSEALRVLTDVRTAHHSNPEFLKALADAASSQKEGETLLWALRRLHEDSRDLSVLDRLVVAEAEYGSADRAQRLLNELPQAMRSERRYVPAWLAVIRHEIHNGRVREAERLLGELGTVAHGEPDYAALMCDILLMKRSHDRALSMAESAIRSKPNDPVGYALAGAALRSMGRIPEASEQLKRSLELGGGARAVEEMALLQWQAGQIAEARRLLTGLTSGGGVNRANAERVSKLITRIQSSAIGNYFRTSACSRIASLIGGGSEVESCVRELAIATAAVARTYSLMAGMVSEGVFEGEREWLRSSNLVADTLTDYVTRLGEQTRAMLSDGAKALSLLVPQAAAEIEAINSRFIRQIGASSNGADIYALGAEAQLQMMRAAVQKAVTDDGLTHLLNSIEDRKRARLFAAPGVFQPGVAADIALVELAAAAIERLSHGFMYSGAADAVLKELRSVRENTSPVNQARDARLAVLKILTILNAQATENNLVGTAGGNL